MKKNLHSSDTRAVQPVVKCLAAWATWPLNLIVLFSYFQHGEVFFFFRSRWCSIPKNFHYSLKNYSILLKKFYLYNPRNYEHLTQEIWGSLGCPLTTTHHICQFWVRSLPVNMPETIVFRQMWSACCNSIPLFRKNDKKCCPLVLSSFMTMLDHIQQLQQRGSWSVFDGKCLITHHYLPRLGRWAADQRRELAESTGGWFLWLGYWKVGTMLWKMSMSERRLCSW